MIDKQESFSFEMQRKLTKLKCMPFDELLSFQLLVTLDFILKCPNQSHLLPLINLPTNHFGGINSFMHFSWY